MVAELNFLSRAAIGVCIGVFLHDFSSPYNFLLFLVGFIKAFLDLRSARCLMETDKRAGLNYSCATLVAIACVIWGYFACSLE